MYGIAVDEHRSILSQLTTPSNRADVLAWYVTTTTLASSIGSEASGRIFHVLQNREGWNSIDAYHALFWIYVIVGLICTMLSLALSDACELPSKEYVQLAQDEDEQIDVADDKNSTPEPLGVMAKSRAWFGKYFGTISSSTRSTMYKLWFLLAVDSLADGMVPLSLTNYYVDIKFSPTKSTLGDVVSASYFLGAIGSAFASPIARKIGLINTMVFTHVPSSASVLLFPGASAFWMAAGLLLVRMGLNNMDQAPRSAFIAAIVKPEERTAVMGITTTLRTLASTTGPTITGALAAGERFWIAFVAAGVCRLFYDFGLYIMFLNTILHKHESKEEEMKDLSRTATQGDTREASNQLSVPDSSRRSRSRSPYRSAVV